MESDLRKDLIIHKIYTAWQFIEYTEKNLATVQYCANTINNIVGKMEMKNIRWEQDIMSDFIDMVDDCGNKVKQLTITEDNAPEYELRVAGEKIDPWFLLDKLIRDFFQYTMNTFDSMSQVINAGLLANNGKKYDSTDIQIISRTFTEQTYIAAFPGMSAWLDKTKKSPEFVYIEAINNRTKHTADISKKISMGIFGGKNITEIGPFWRKEVQHKGYDLSDLLNDILVFLRNSWNEFPLVFEKEYKRDVYTQNRLHEITGVHQQRIKDKPDQDYSYAYYISNSKFDSMPENLYILLVNEQNNEIYAHECPFDVILIMGNDNKDVLGRYCAEDSIGDDCLLHYRKYKKDNSLKGLACLANEIHKKAVFYRKNPFFIVESVSNDEMFLQRVSLPF